MRLILDSDVARVFTMPDAIAAMRTAFSQFGQGAGAVLARNRATAEHTGPQGVVNATISAMGASLPASDVVGTKVYATVKGQFDFVIVLFSATTGKAVATLQANELTRLRTAAATAVAVEKLALPTARTLSIFGAGTQARAHADALCRVHRFERVLVSARSGAEAFAAQLQTELNLPVQAVDAATAAAQGDVIATCTRAQEALFDGALVRPGTLVAAVGSSKPVARELDDTLLSSAAHLVVEWKVAAQQEAGEWVRAAPGVIEAAKVSELGAWLSGTADLKRRPEDIVVYKSVGIGLEDVAVAQQVWQRLCADV